tara:strand:+ start:1698 stop:3176 length:1479 start_codon:yes stop_codon:yes gene_type:complete
MIKKRFLIVSQAVLGGVLSGLSLCVGASYLMPIGLALLWSVHTRPALSLLWGVNAVLASHSWLLSLHPLDWIGIPHSLSFPIAIVIWIFCGILGGFWVGCWSWLGNKIKAFHPSIDSKIKEKLLHSFILSCLWGLAEIALGQSPLFWIGVGASVLPGDKWLAGMAQWIGSGGLATLQLLIGWWLWQISYSLFYRLRWKKLFFIGFGLNLIVHFLGWSLLNEGVNESSKLVAIWQPDIPIRKKFSKDQIKQFPYSFQSAIDKAKKSGADFLIAPEGSVMANQELLEPAPLKILAGGFRWVNGTQRNSILFFDIGNKQFLDAIDKNRLVPLGEWVPNLPFISNIGLSAVGGIEKGPPSRIFSWKGPPLAASICYELSNGKAISKAVLEGAEWILATANLDPYPFALQKQFLSLAQLRSIENSREIITVANSGPSSFINSEGKIETLLPPFQESFGLSMLHLKKEKTLYVRFGEAPLIALFLIGLFGYYFCLIKD